MKKSFILNWILILFITSLFYFCKKEFDTPPVKSAADANKINIQNIKAKYFTGVNYKFKSDSNLYCVITADETSGNLFKELYVKDITGALHIKLLASGGFFIGDSIRINLQGATLKADNSLIELDSVDSEKNIVKLASGLNPQPFVTTLAQVISNTSATNAIQSKLVKLDNVEFVNLDQDKTYADVITKVTGNRVMRSCDGNILTVRTSGYASFAGDKTPTKNGSVVGIISQFGNTMQLILRNSNEVIMTNSLCPPPTTATFVLSAPVSSLNENFNSQTTTNNSITLNGWINYDETGTKTWLADTYNSVTSCKATSFGSTNLDAKNTIWLITPPIKASATPTLSFKTAIAFASNNHPNPFTVWISKSFDGKNLTAANTWTNITNAVIAPLNSAQNAWVNSGTINLASYLPANYTGNYFIAFKYYGNKPSGFTTSYYLDDVLIQ